MDLQINMRALADHKADWGEDVLWDNSDAKVAGVYQ